MYTKIKETFLPQIWPLEDITQQQHTKMLLTQTFQMQFMVESYIYKFFSKIHNKNEIFKLSQFLAIFRLLFMNLLYGKWR